MFEEEKEERLRTTQSKFVEASESCHTRHACCHCQEMPECHTVTHRPRLDKDSREAKSKMGWDTYWRRESTISRVNMLLRLTVLFIIPCLPNQFSHLCTEQAIHRLRVSDRILLGSIVRATANHLVFSTPKEGISLCKGFANHGERPHLTPCMYTFTSVG